MTFAFSVLAAPSHAEPALHTREVAFPFEQKRYLFSKQGPGGLAIAIETSESTEALPVVVFLHGMNANQDMHPWVSPGANVGWDIRPGLVDMVKTGKVAPFVLVAPTHTRWATAANVMWPKFEIDGLLDAAETALGKHVVLDRHRVILVGHSGAGCNLGGGVVGVPPARKTTLQAIVMVDGCLDADIAERYGELAGRAPIFFFHQPAWSRPIDLLERSCEARGVPCSIEKVEGLGGSAHNAILPFALARVLPRLLPPRPASSPPPSPRVSESPASAVTDLRAPREH